MPEPDLADIALDAGGAHHGFLRLPYSRDDSAWGSVMIPISVVRNGKGPTALLTGANHGDEYEVPVTLQDLALRPDPARIRGRVIIVPAYSCLLAELGPSMAFDLGLHTGEGRLFGFIVKCVDFPPQTPSDPLTAGAKSHVRL